PWRGSSERIRSRSSRTTCCGRRSSSRRGAAPTTQRRRRGTDRSVGSGNLLHRDGLIAVEDLSHAVELVSQAWMYGNRRVACAHQPGEVVGIAVALSILIEQGVEVIGDARNEGIARLRVRLPSLDQRGELHPVRRNSVLHELRAYAVRNAVIVE